jgi:type VI protein secretion system component VasK
MAVLFILAIIFGLVWIVEFAQLMELRDEDFPGRHDKALWVAAFVFGNVLGAAAFYLWKRDRAFEAREAVFLRMARDSARETSAAPPASAAAGQPPRPAASSTAIQRAADNRV